NRLRCYNWQRILRSRICRNSRFQSISLRCQCNIRHAQKYHRLLCRSQYRTPVTLSSKLSLKCSWSEGHYRGYYELHLTYDEATAYYYGYPDIKHKNETEYLSAVFSVEAGANHVSRPIAGGAVGFGSLKGGVSKNHTLS